jgi:hypothetical protein
MSGSQALRVLLCGLIAGVIWSLLTSVSLHFVGSDLLAAVGTSAPHARADGAVFFATDLLMGVWVVWVYSAIAPRYGPGPRTAVLAGISWWLLKTLQSVKWVALGFVPVEVTVGPGIATLATAIVASTIGAQMYEKVHSAQQPAVSPHLN